jgi:hypothetical protein
MVPVKEEKVQKNVPKQASQELTLGDLIQLGKKKKEGPTERKLS